MKLPNKLRQVLSAAADVTCRSCQARTYVSGHNPVETGSRPDTTVREVYQQSLQIGFRIDMHDNPRHLGHIVEKTLLDGVGDFVPGSDGNIGVDNNMDLCEYPPA